MSSEAAAYFADALASAPEAHGSATRGPEIRTRVGELSPSENTVHAGAIAQATEITDEELLKRMSQGTKEALALLFRRYAKSVRNIAFRILRNEPEADDLVQDVFLLLFRKASLFDGSSGGASAWILRLTYLCAFDRRRYLNSRHFYSTEDLDESTLDIVEQRTEIPFHAKSIEGILGRELAARFNLRLTSEQKETIRLYFFEGYSLKEIAELTGQSRVNVRNNYYRGLERIRKYVLPEKFRSK